MKSFKKDKRSIIWEVGSTLILTLLISFLAFVWAGWAAGVLILLFILAHVVLFLMMGVQDV